jgi:hypothetical protein
MKQRLMTMSPKTQLWNLRFDVVRSVRYHDFRRGAFDLFNKVTTIGILAASSGAVVSLLLAVDSNKQAPTFAIWMSAIAAFLSILNIALGSPTKISLYTNLKNKHSALLRKVELAQPEEAQILALREEYDKIESEEPDISDAVNRIAYNKAVDAVGADQAQKRPVGIFTYLAALV